jgi:hypothetical protein
MSAVTTLVRAALLAEDFADDISELSSRSENGIDVALLWRRCDDAAIVVVVDRRTGEAFFLDVDENDNALDMFHHPYAYAAHRHGADHRLAA